MNKDNIGAILRQAIKERGFTQEEFAEITGIGLSSLKKYMSGKVSYSVEVLEIMADRLQCSYDYLLGKSLTPERELRDVKEATRLSDGALERITYHARQYNDDDYSRRYLNTLSTLVQTNFLVDRIIDFLYIDSKEECMMTDNEYLPQINIWVGQANLTVPDIEDAYLSGIIRALTEAREVVNENISSIRRNYRTKKIETK
jgi:transcriptional regulator with XRE-family HTH domain